MRSKILDHPEKCGEGKNVITKAQITYSEHKMILVQSNLNCAKICVFSLKLQAVNGQAKCFCLNQGQKTYEHHLLKMLLIAPSAQEAAVGDSLCCTVKSQYKQNIS